MAYTDAADNEPDTTDAAGADEDAGEAKVSQQEAQYGRGSPMKHCGVCTYYEGDEEQGCSRVESPISGFGICNLFNMQQNPFGSRIGPQEAQMIDNMMNSPPDQSSAAQAGPAPGGRVQIGNRAYGGPPQ